MEKGIKLFDYRLYIRYICTNKNPFCEHDDVIYYNIFRNSYELEALQETLAEVKNSINTQNVNKFENCVEVHMKHIQSGLSQVSGNLRRIFNQRNNIFFS